MLHLREIRELDEVTIEDEFEIGKSIAESDEGSWNESIESVRALKEILSFDLYGGEMPRYALLLQEGDKMCDRDIVARIENQLAVREKGPSQASRPQWVDQAECQLGSASRIVRGPAL